MGAEIHTVLYKCITRGTVATGPQTAPHLRLHQTPTDPYTVGKRAVTSLQPCTRPPHTRSRRERRTHRRTHIFGRQRQSRPAAAGWWRSRRRGSPQPPAVSRRAAAQSLPPLPPPRSSRLPRSHRLQPAGEREEHRIVENDEDGRREDARHLVLDGGDGARRPRGSVQQQGERKQ